MDRALLFWGICIPTRLAITRVAYEGSPALRAISAAVAYTWLSGALDNKKGAFGGPVFWADERPVHGALWAAYSLSNDYRFLLTDTVFGALNWIKG